jgi:hypothetical protein
MRAHRYVLGQYVTYAERSSGRGSREIFADLVLVGGYKVAYLLPRIDQEPRYQIHSADQCYDRIAREGELQDDVGDTGRPVSPAPRRGVP